MAEKFLVDWGTLSIALRDGGWPDREARGVAKVLEKENTEFTTGTPTLVEVERAWLAHCLREESMELADSSSE